MPVLQSKSAYGIFLSKKINNLLAFSLKNVIIIAINLALHEFSGAIFILKDRFIFECSILQYKILKTFLKGGYEHDKWNRKVV